MKTAPSKTPTFYIFPPFLPKPPPHRSRPSRHKYRYICFMCQWISAVCPPIIRCLSAHIFFPSAYLRCPSAHIFSPSAHLLCPSAHIFHPSTYLRRPPAYIFSPSTYILFPSTHIFSPSTYILYIRCNSLPPRVRPVGVGILPPHAKAINIGYKGLWHGSEDESCRLGTGLRSSGGHLPAFLTNSFCPICVIKRWLIIKRIAILLHKHRGSVHANVVFIRKNLPE